MEKTKEELNAIKEEVETLNQKLTELSEDELEQVIGGESSIQDTARILIKLRKQKAMSVSRSRNLFGICITI